MKNLSHSALRNVVHACEFHRGRWVAKFGLHQLIRRISAVCSGSYPGDCRWPNSNRTEYILFSAGNIIRHVFRAGSGFGFGFGVCLQVSRRSDGQVGSFVGWPASYRTYCCLYRFLNITRRIQSWTFSRRISNFAMRWLEIYIISLTLYVYLICLCKNSFEWRVGRVNRVKTERIIARIALGHRFTLTAAEGVKIQKKTKDAFDDSSLVTNTSSQA